MSYVAFLDCSMQHPFRHSFPSRLPRAAHKFLSDWMSTRTPPCCRSRTPDPRLPILLRLALDRRVLWILALTSNGPSLLRWYNLSPISIPHGISGIPID